MRCYYFPCCSSTQAICPIYLLFILLLCSTTKLYTFLSISRIWRKWEIVFCSLLFPPAPQRCCIVMYPESGRIAVMLLFYFPIFLSSQYKCWKAATYYQNYLRTSIHSQYIYWALTQFHSEVDQFLKIVIQFVSVCFPRFMIRSPEKLF